MILLENYLFWLVVISLICLISERVFPWRKEQKLFRREWGQDLFWLLFNAYLFGLIMEIPFKEIQVFFDEAVIWSFGFLPSEFKIISGFPLWQEVLILLFIADFLEWAIHNLLHRWNWLWSFHRVHHSIITMDWIGNFRFHWLEIIVYKSLKYLPIALLGASGKSFLMVAVFSTFIGHLNHSNLNITWGPLRYILNSPRMHIWHHEKKLRGKAGVNFAVVFSFWDWIFKTAYFPKNQEMPENIGFAGQEKISPKYLK